MDARGSGKRGRPPKIGRAERISFHGRLRRDLHERLQAAAERESRSLNQEIERRLEHSLEQESYGATARPAA